MRELVLSGNELVKLKLENLAPRLNGAHIGQFLEAKQDVRYSPGYPALFDSHSLFADMYANPGSYLNGTAPYNVTGAIDTCVFEIGASSPSSCAMVEGDDRDSYLWYVEPFNLE